MVSLANMRGRLPSLYRPEPDDGTLLSQLLAAVAAVLDELQNDAAQVMQAHWVDFADAALFSPFAVRQRELADLPPLDPLDSADRELAATFPYVDDLARLGALLPVLHWRDPAYLREVVEAYRTRLHRTVAIYKNGLGTLPAIRSMVEVQLPLDMARPADQRDHPFWLEEFAPAPPTLLPVPTIGAPAGIFGPLMGWSIASNSVRPVTSTVYIRAQATTVRPMIERTDGRVGIAYTGTLAPGETLRLRPAFASWLATADGLQRADSAADPTAPGPWADAAGAPPAPIRGAAPVPRWRALGRGGRRTLALRRRHLGVGPGRSARGALPGGRPGAAPGRDCGRPAAHRSLPCRRHLCAGARDCAGGPRRQRPGPGTGDTWWLATDAGAGVLDGDAFTLSALRDVEVFTVFVDRENAIFFGAALGLFLYQPLQERWHYYAGTVRTEQAGDWRPFTPGSLPAEDQVALPAVHAICRSGDASLWLGTAQGLARYRARSVGGLTYETILEAFPDLTTGPVTQIELDQRGLTWFATDRSLFRFDGRQLWQFRTEGGWVQLGHADQVYVAPGEARPRGAWRFERGAGSWRQFDTSQFVFDPLDPSQVRSTGELPVSGFLWTDGVAAEIGVWDGAAFQPTTAVAPSTLQMRVKPTNLRIVAGGIPAVPRVLPGASSWRYLAREPDDGVGLPNPPGWTSEARLLPPPALDEAIPGRFESIIPAPDSRYDATVFAYPPVAQIWFAWQDAAPLTVLARIKRRAPGDQIDPVILERVWQGIQQVRPAGVRVMVAVEEEIVQQ